jgi:cardiolipin synthase
VQVGPHDVKLLRDGEEVFPAMRAAIARAERRVSLEIYWVGDDAVGRAFRRELARAASRGARVRVLVDGFGCLALPRGFWRELEVRGGEVEVFRPILAGVDRTFPRGVLARDHRKLLVVDGREAFVGGLNLARNWLPVAEGGGGWRDTAVHVIGTEIGEHLTGLFDETWKRCRGTRDPMVSPKAIWTSSDGNIGVIANTPKDRVAIIFDLAILYSFASVEVEHARNDDLGMIIILALREQCLEPDFRFAASHISSDNVKGHSLDTGSAATKED